MVVIGGFRLDLSITRMIDGNFGNVSAGVLIGKSRIKENGGNKFNFFSKFFVWLLLGVKRLTSPSLSLRILR